MATTTPPAWQRALWGLLGRVETGISGAWARGKVRAGLLGRVTVVPYRGWGTPNEWWLRGRVMEDPGIAASRQGDTTWTNLVASLRRFTSAELPGARVRVHGPTGQQTVVTDEEGFYDLTLAGDGADPGWHDVDVEVLEPLARRQRPPRVTGRVLVLPPDPRFAVVSDLDDTVLRTGLTEGLKAASIVLLNNARTRSPFGGVAAFYQALARGTGEGEHPVFYVSGSPWNLYDLLDEFLAHHGLPAGPLLLRDWGLGHGGLYAERTQVFKLRMIRGLLATYPDLRVVLIGDSGQHDPEIYAAIVRDDPARVLAIYVRDVTTPERDEEVHCVVAQVEALGVPMVLAHDSVAAAEHAAAADLIDPAAVAAVRAEAAGAAGAGAF